MAAKYLCCYKTLFGLLFLFPHSHTQADQALVEKPVSAEFKAHDQIFAQIPRERAASASAALAELNIALYKAKKTTERTLCNGHWSPTGKTLRQTGPLAVVQPTRQKIWLYQSIRESHPITCDQVSRVQFFLEMSRYLPAWISIQPAGMDTAFNQGFIQLQPIPHLAER